jgi:hypothetical protein
MECVVPPHTVRQACHSSTVTRSVSTEQGTTLGLSCILDAAVGGCAVLSSLSTSVSFIVVLAHTSELI